MHVPGSARKPLNPIGREHRFASEPQVAQSQTPDDDARRNRGREGDQYPRVARLRRKRPKRDRRVGGRHGVTASTFINICPQLRYRWNSVHGGTSTELIPCRPGEFRGQPGSNGLRQRFIVLRCLELFTRLTLAIGQAARLGRAQWIISLTLRHAGRDEESSRRLLGRPGTSFLALRFLRGSKHKGTPAMRTMYLGVAALLISGGTAAAQTSNPRTDQIDGEGINMDAPAPLTSEPGHPADPLMPNTSNPAAQGTTTGQAPKDERLPADRGDTRPVPNAPR
jgi:hypothetical protein